MAIRVQSKKRVVVSIENLSEELKEELKARYPLGFNDHLIRINKPSGDFFHAVVLEMTDVTYLVKVKVRVDKNPNEELDKDYFDGQSKDDEMKDADEIPDTADENDDL